MLEANQGRDLSLALMSITSRFSKDRPRVQQSRMGEIDLVGIQYYAFKAVEWEPTGLWNLEETPDSWRIRLAKGLYGRGYDGLTPDHKSSLVAIAKFQVESDGKLRAFLEDNKDSGIFQFTDEDMEQLDSLKELSDWARNSLDT